jgi:hypothetical protein
MKKETFEGTRIRTEVRKQRKRKGDHTLRCRPWRPYRNANRDGTDPRGRDGRRNTQDDRRADRLTIQPWRHTCGFGSRKGTKTYKPYYKEQW